MEKSVFAFLIFCLPGVGDYASRTAVFSPAFCRRDYAYCGLHMLLCNVSKLGNWKFLLKCTCHIEKNVVQSGYRMALVL